jgi:hypothetical protein
MPPSSINTSIRAYLDQFRGKADDWAIDLLDVAYNIEFGFLTEDQSSLAMVGLHINRYGQTVLDVRRERREVPHQRRLIGADQGAGRRAAKQDRHEAGLGADLARLQRQKDRHGLRCAGRPADAKLRCGDPRFALHQASAGDRLGEAKAR